MKVDKLTMELRVRTVMDWILAGHMTKDIIGSCGTKWNVDQRQAYKYIKAARVYFVKLTEEDIKERLAFHIAARMQIYVNLDDKNKPMGARAAVEILKDIAELEGFYMQKVDVTTQGNPIHSQVIEATLTLK